VFHVLSGRYHREAHRSAKVISAVIDTGMYGKIRHPLYAGLIVSNLGIGLAFGVYWTLGLAVLFSVLYLVTAVEEEKYLLESLGDEYAAYKERVRWRMIPGIF
jgi:protein-S-isoprenylcysteine O-methyltransferase Ste14